VYRLLKNGVKVTYKGTDDDDQEETTEIVSLIDWIRPENNDYLLGSQFWISGDYGKKRADLVGLPSKTESLSLRHKSIKGPIPLRRGMVIPRFYANGRCREA
jgi:hypothetical protein